MLPANRFYPSTLLRPPVKGIQEKEIITYKFSADRINRLKIGTLNCKGLADEKKRKDVFNWLRQKKKKKKNLTYIVYRRRISKIARENKQGGNPNGAMRLSLAAWIAKVVGLLFYLTIHLNNLCVTQCDKRSTRQIYHFRYFYSFQQRCTLVTSVWSKHGLARIFQKSERKSNQ